MGTTAEAGSRRLRLVASVSGVLTEYGCKGSGAASGLVFSPGDEAQSDTVTFPDEPPDDGVQHTAG